MTEKKKSKTRLMAEASSLSKKGQRWTTEKNLKRLTDWASQGLTLLQIAEKMGIDRRTLYTWRVQSPEIYEAIEAGMEGADDVIVAALYQKAQGFDYPIVTEFYDGEGKLTGKQVKKDKSLPDTRALQFWLMNRDRKRWGGENSKEVNVSVDDGFYEALGLTASKDWEDEEDVED